MFLKNMPNVKAYNKKQFFLLKIYGLQCQKILSEFSFGNETL